MIYINHGNDLKVNYLCVLQHNFNKIKHKI